MASESSGKHAWVPIAVAIITSTAAIVASFIGADGRMEAREAKKDLEAAQTRVKTLEVDLASTRATLKTTEDELRVEREARTNDRVTRPENGGGPPGPEPSPPARRQTIRVKLRTPAGYDQADVYLNGSLVSVARRTLDWLEIEAPKLDTPTTVKLEARGVSDCQRLIHLKESDTPLQICSGVR